MGAMVNMMRYLSSIHRWLIPFGLALLLVMVNVSHTAAMRPTMEDAVKAAMLHNFVKFVRWPATVSAPEKGNSLVLGVLGHDPLQEKLFKLAAEGGQAPLVRTLQINSVQELANRKHELQVLYVSRSARADIDAILRVLQGAPILTVCDDELFAEQGGIMNFVRHNSRIRFDINLDAAKESHLQISSNLHDLARVIVVDGVSRRRR